MKQGIFWWGGSNQEGGPAGLDRGCSFFVEEFYSSLVITLLLHLYRSCSDRIVPFKMDILQVVCRKWCYISQWICASRSSTQVLSLLIASWLYLLEFWISYNKIQRGEMFSELGTCHRCLSDAGQNQIGKTLASNGSFVIGKFQPFVLFLVDSICQLLF